MGGIAGILSFSRSRVDARKVERMLELMGRRGPDDRGVRRSVNGRLVLGACRSLLEGGDNAVPMPVVNEAQDVWLVLDGEIDNHRALRHSLRLDGHHFRSESGGEVVVHAYEQYGLGFLDYLHGRFAMALWDEQRHRLVLARDRLGERPLYWTRSAGMLAFASEGKLLFEAASLQRRLDIEYLPEFLAHGFVLAPNTLMEGIRKLGPGEALVVERGNRIHPVTWWAPCNDERRSAAVRALSSEHHENNLRVLLDSAIADRLNANLSIAAMLDGEPESVAMAAAMGRLLGRTVDALVLGEDAARAIELAGPPAEVRLAAVAPGDAQMLASVPDYLRAMDEPVTDPEAIGVWWLARAMANSGVAVGLGSFGGATALLGPELLARHRRAPPAWRLLRVLPPLGRRLGTRLLSPLLVALGHRDSAQALRHAVDGEPPLPAPEVVFADPAIALGGDFKPLPRTHSPGEAVARVRRDMPDWISADELGALAFVETRTTVAEGHLMALDRMSMWHSVEIRLPFLDDALVDYALAIPSAERAPGGRAKDLLRRALRGLVPAEAAAGVPRRAPEPPMVGWFEGELGGVFEEALRHGRIFESGLLDREACRALLRDHQSGRQCHYRRLWTLLVLSQWIELLDLEIPGLPSHEPARQAAVG